jgi:hypothetical protein
VITPTYVASGGAGEEGVTDLQAMKFNGTLTGEYVDLPDGFDDFRAGQTFAVWAKIDADAASGIRYFDSQNTEYKETIQLARGAGVTTQLKFRGKNGAVFNGVVETDVWKHFVVTLDEALSLKLYVNGVLSPVVNFDDSPVAFPDFTTRISNYIGRQVKDGDDDVHRFKGLIGDLRVYNYAISANDVATLYSQSARPFCRFQPDMDKTANGGNNNCRVDLAEFANFAQNWLDCGKYPVTACP